MIQRTIIEILDNLRELCVKFYRDHPIELGRDGRVVEADERIFPHKVYTCFLCWEKCYTCFLCWGNFALVFCTVKNFVFDFGLRFKKKVVQ